ncbi:MAG: dynamin family protein [Pleurocapsa sp. MO_226.B13]|nr:dynamin family protein [Pleurocapsa sp. MO_226.B13]
MSSQKLLAIQNRLQDVAAKLGQTFKPIEISVQSTGFHHDAIAVCGMIGRGKSSFINAILASNLLPINIAPKLSALREYHIKVTNMSQSLIQAHLLSGNVENVEPKDIDEAMLEAWGSKLKYLEIQAPFSVLPEGVQLIETPSIGSIDFDARTKSILEEVSNVILIVDANLSLSSQEITFLKLLPKNICNVIVAANKIDVADAQIQSIQVNSIREQIKTLSLDISVDVFKISIQSISNSSETYEWEQLIAKLTSLVQKYIEKGQTNDEGTNIKSQATQLLEAAENIKANLEAEKISVAKKTSQDVNVKKINELRQTKKLIQDVIKDQERDIVKTVSESLEALAFRMESDIRANRKDLQSIKSDLQNWLKQEQKRIKQRLERHFSSILDDTNYAVGGTYQLKVQQDEIRVNTVEAINNPSVTKSLTKEYRHLTSMGVGAATTIASLLYFGGRLLFSFSVGGVVATGAWLLIENLSSSGQSDVKFDNIASIILPKFEHNVRHNTKELYALVEKAFTEAITNTESLSSSSSPEEDDPCDELVKIIAELKKVINHQNHN